MPVPVEYDLLRYSRVYLQKLSKKHKMAKNLSVLPQTARQPQNVDVSLRKRAIAATAQPFLPKRLI